MKKTNNQIWKASATMAFVALIAPQSHAALLAYEGFSSSSTGTGDDYQQDVTIRSTSDARVGFTGAWSNSAAAPGGIDYESRAENLAYSNFKTGDSGSLEIYEARAGKNPLDRGINRSLSYTMPETADVYFVFGWATDDAAAHGFSLSGTRDIGASVSTSGAVNVNFEGGSSDNFTGGTANMDGSWNTLIIRAINDPTGGASADFYDSYELWLNPTISAGSGDVSQLGTPSGTGNGIIREHNGSGPVEFTGASFNAKVGTGDEVRFDEFYITTDVADFLAVPEPSALLLTATGVLGLLVRRRR